MDTKDTDLVPSPSLPTEARKEESTLPGRQPPSGSNLPSSDSSLPNPLSGSPPSSPFSRDDAGDDFRQQQPHAAQGTPQELPPVLDPISAAKKSPETSDGSLKTPAPSEDPSSSASSEPASSKRNGASQLPPPESSNVGSPSTADTTMLIPTTNEPEDTQNSYRTFPKSLPMDAKGESPGFPDSGKDMNAKDSVEKDDTIFVSMLSCFAAIGGLLFGYDTGIVSGSMLLIQPYFKLNTVWEEAVVSGTVGAAAVFSILAGFVCDRIGRKITIMLSSLIFAAGAVLMGASTSKEMLLGGRIVVGVGIGFASMIVPVYVAEVAPSYIRGRLVTLNQLFITIGILLSSIIAGSFSEMKDTGWRYMLGLAGVPGLIQFIGFIWLPETPRWLVSEGREEDARQVLRRVRGRNDIEEELQEVKDAMLSEHTGWSLGRILRTPHVRKALFIGCGLQLFQQLCGINTVIYYSATILKEAGFHSSKAIWLVTVPFSINFLATFIGLWAVEKIGRRLLLIFSFLGIFVALVVLGVGFLLSSQHSVPVNTTIHVQYPNGSAVTDQCQDYTLCKDCVKNDHCGYCYDDSHPGAATCLLVAKNDDEDSYSDYGRCAKNSQGGLSWAYGFCPTEYGWVAVLGLALFVLSFAPGLGPMPWTVNSEIYPMWARSTGVSVATMVNWVCNLLVSFTFLTLLETITKYGTFFLFAGITVLGTIFTVVFLPETKNKTLEEMEQVFLGSSKPPPPHPYQRKQPADDKIMLTTSEGL